MKTYLVYTQKSIKEVDFMPQIVTTLMPIVTKLSKNGVKSFQSQLFFHS